MLKRFWRPGTGIFLGIWLVLLIGGRSRLFQDPGTFWHTVVGDQMLSSGQLVYHDTFSFTFAGQTWIGHQWLGECLMALLHRQGGLDTLLLFTVTVLAGLYTWLAQRLIRSGLHWSLASVLVVLTIAASSSHFHIRPHIGTILFLGITYAFLCDFEAGRIGLSRLFWLVPLYLVWTSVHGGMLGGLCTIVLAAAGWYLAKLIGKESPITQYQQLLPLSLLIGACGLTAFLNPYGWRLPWTWISIMDSPRLPHLIQEHAPLNPAKLDGWMVLLFGFVYGFALVGVLPRWPRVTWLLPLVWFYLACTRVRHAPLFSITAALALADMLPHTRWAAWLARPGSDLFVFPEAQGDGEANDERRKAKEQERTIPFAFRLSPLILLVSPFALPVAVVLAAFLLQVRQVPVPVLGHAWARLDPKDWPVDLLPALKRYPHPSLPQFGGGKSGRAIPIFNEYQYGGFLIYCSYFYRDFPHYLVFVDDRCELYGDDWLQDYVAGEWQDTAGHIRKWEQTYRDYGTFDLALTKTGSGYDRYFSSSDQWLAMPQPGAATLYRRKDYSVKIAGR